MTQDKTVRIKVFLIDFSDVRAPSGYTRAFVDSILLSATPAHVTPDAHEEPLDGSVNQYLYASTDGAVVLEGTVLDWVHSQLANAQIPHLSPTMIHPERVEPEGAPTHFGDTWPVVVAETLRLHGFTSEQYPTGDQLRTAIRQLPDGNMADKLVFLHTDLSDGGARRNPVRMKRLLDAMSAPNVQRNTRPDDFQPWSTLWDDGWAGLPEVLVLPLLSAGLGSREPDGTFRHGVETAADALRMEGMSLLLHEIAAMVLGTPDLDAPEHAPWGDQCLMAGPTTETHSHIPLGSLARFKAGLMNFTEMPLASHRLELKPLETHNQAVRLPNGPPDSEEFLVVSNRADLRARRFEPAVVTGRGVLAYRWDPHRRTATLQGGRPVRKESSIVRRSADWRNSSLLWSPGQAIDAFPTAIFEGPATLRNSRGELWFTLDRIASDGPDRVADLSMQALDLVADYHRATWFGMAPGRRTLAIRPDRMDGFPGHALLADVGLFLQPRLARNGRIRGSYPVGRRGSPPRTLYATLAGSDGGQGVDVRFTSGLASYVVSLRPGQIERVVMDFPTPGAQLDLLVQSRRLVESGRLLLAQGWLVPDAPRVYDFVANASAATWTTGRGELELDGRGGGVNGEVSIATRRTLHNGVTYFGRSLFTHPNWSQSGFVTGVYRDVPVPRDGGFIRGAVGWAAGRQVRSNGAAISLRWRPTGRSPWRELLSPTILRSPAGDGVDNDLLYLELPLPRSIAGTSIDVELRVDADGSSSQDWVSWVKLALTSA